MPISTDTRTKASELFPEPGLTPVSLVRSHRPFVPPPEVRGLPFWGKPGWARFTVDAVLTEDEDQRLDGLGWLTLAEWCEGEVSHAIRPDPENPGALLHLTLEEAPVGTRDGEPAWREVVTVTGHKAAAGRHLVYHVYLIDEGQGAIRRACDAFVGFKEGKA